MACLCSPGGSVRIITLLIPLLAIPTLACNGSIGPSPSASMGYRLAVDNLDGPDVLVVPWDGANPVSVACGTGQQIDGPALPWHIQVREAPSGKTLMDQVIATPVYSIDIRGESAFVNPGTGIGPAPPECPTSTPPLSLP